MDSMQQKIIIIRSWIKNRDYEINDILLRTGVNVKLLDYKIV